MEDGMIGLWYLESDIDVPKKVYDIKVMEIVSSPKPDYYLVRESGMSVFHIIQFSSLVFHNKFYREVEDAESAAKILEFDYEREINNG